MITYKNPKSIVFGEVSYPAPIKNAFQTPKDANIHTIIKPIYKLMRPFFIWPYKYGENDEILPLTAKDKRLSLVFLTAITAHFCWNIYSKISQSITWLVLDNAFTICSYALTALSIFSSNFSTRKLTEAFMKDLAEMGKCEVFAETPIFGRLRRKALATTFAAFSIHLTFVFLNGLFIACYGGTYVVRFMSIYVTQTLLVLAFLKIYCKAEILQYHFLCLNSYFSNAIGSNCTSVETKQKLKLLTRTHGRLCNLIANCNDAHGLQTLIIIGSVVISVLNILYGFGIYEYSLEVSLKNAVFVVEFGLTFFYSGLAILLPIKCSAARKEALRTGSLANDALIDPNVDESCQADLRALIEQIFYRNPHFSVAGIFVMDLTTISTILGIIASYFVVLLQFRDAPVCNCNFNSTSA